MWDNSIITDAGSALLSRWAVGGTLKITRAAAGTGCVDAVALAKQTTLLDQKQSASIVSYAASPKATQYTIRLIAADESYIANQIGIFAKLNDEDETLIALYQDETGIPIPDKEEMPDFFYAFYATIQMNNGPIEVVIDSQMFVTRADVVEIIDETALRFDVEQELTQEQQTRAWTNLGAEGRTNEKIRNAIDKAFAHLPAHAEDHRTNETLTWDGDETGRAVVVALDDEYEEDGVTYRYCIKYIHVSDKVPSMSDFVNGAIISFIDEVDGVVEESSYAVPSESIAELECGTITSNYFFVVPSDNLASDAELTFPKKGIYFLKGIDGYDSSYISALTIPGYTFIDVPDQLTPEMIGAARRVELLAHASGTYYPHTADSVGAAPAGFGLGRNASRKYTDVNEMLYNGWYAVPNNCANSPTGVNAALIRVDRFSHECIIQTLYSFGTPTYVMRRAWQYSSWDEWEYINPTMYAGIEYKTTERVNNRPVYTKRVLVGSATSDMNVVVPITAVNTLVVIRAAVHIDGSPMPCDPSNPNSAWHAVADIRRISNTQIQIAIKCGSNWLGKTIYAQLWYW